VLTEKPRPLVTRNLAAGLLSLAVSFICIVFFKTGYLGWLISGTLSSILLFILFFRPIWINEKIYPYLPDSKNKKRIKNYIWIALPIIPHNLGHTLLSSSDRIIMSLYNVSIDNIGLYSNGYQTGEYISVIIIGIFTALGPSLQRAFRTNDKLKLLYYLRLTFISIALMVLLFSLWAHVFYDIFIRNETLKDAYRIAVAIAFSFMFYSIYAYLSLPVFIKKKTQHILWLVFFPAIINIVLNIIFIPFFGYKCVAYTTVASYWTVPLFAFIHPFYRSEMTEMLGNFRKELFCYLISGIVLFLLVVLFFYQLNFQNLILATIVTGFFYVIFYKKLQTTAKS
jgi:O-antigen/teichoic acid export membrane protein